MISLRPINIDDLTPAARCRLFAAFRNKLGGYARSKRLPFTCAWCREINREGSGEHMHLLMHMPARHRQHFDDTIIGWYPGPGEVDISTATQRTRIDYRGRRLSAIGYISKQMTPQAWYKRGLIRKAGGTIVGKRSGVTTNLGWKAIAAYRTTHGIMSRNPFTISDGQLQTVPGNGTSQRTAA